MCKKCLSERFFTHTKLMFARDFFDGGGGSGGYILYCLPDYYSNYRIIVSVPPSYVKKFHLLARIINNKRGSDAYLMKGWTF